MLLNHMHLKCHLYVASGINLCGVVVWQCGAQEGVCSVHEVVLKICMIIDFLKIPSFVMPPMC